MAQAVPPTMQPRTTHTTYFQGCRIGVNALEGGGWRVSIIDPKEHHTYIFDFEDEGVKQHIIQGLTAVVIPNIRIGKNGDPGGE